MAVGLRTQRMQMVVRASLLLVLPCVHTLAVPSGGLRLEPARRAHAAALAVTTGCGSLRLLPLAGDVAGLSVHRGGFRLEPMRLADKPLAIPIDLLRQIDRVAAAYGHEVSLMKAVVRVESAFNPAAVSSKGALGLMQIMPTTATELGVADPGRELFDPEVNLRAGARYLRMLRNRFPDRLDLAIAAYNAGEGAVDRWSGIPPYAETRAYVDAVLAWHVRYQQDQGSDVELPRAPSSAIQCRAEGAR